MWFGCVFSACWYIDLCMVYIWCECVALFVDGVGWVLLNGKMGSISGPGQSRTGSNRQQPLSSPPLAKTPGLRRSKPWPFIALVIRCPLQPMET